MKVDYISDLHLDFHIKHDGNYEKWQQKTISFLETLLPEEIGEVLIIAGDLSHYNIQSYWILDYCSQVYQQVYFVFGNHDYYLVSGGQRKKYRNDSILRDIELIALIAKLNNVNVLRDFDIVEYKGVKFAGSTNWYPLKEFKDKQFFNSISNDSRLISGFDIQVENYNEMLSYKNMEDVDILVTHVPTIILNSHRKYDSTSCYLNELKQIKARHVISGHVHEQGVYKKGHIKFYINALGYPSEWMSNLNPLQYSKEERQEFSKQWNRIKSFEV